ncbi:periphilin-1 isoform X2 [Clupea harengus]|uniref:Periphilin-1 isoform X2 n=1 Tax=Clupea harengus TaxID=7950 RepID=A0A8M1KU91_CLUHA|nr:periphilin-1 isoform X2 [Clupea harengus]
MAFRRDRNVRDVYEDRFPVERGGPYRRSGFGRPDEDYGRGFEYNDNPRFYPGGGPPRSYHGEGPHFAGEHRAVPPGRRDESYQYYRGARDEPLPGRPIDFRPGGRVGPLPPPPSGRGQGSYPPPRSLPALGPEAGDDTVMQAILSLDRGEDHEGMRRKAPFPAVRERSPLRRDVPPSPSPHSRSGSSISSRSYSPDRAKTHPYPPPPGKSAGVGSAGAPGFRGEIARSWGSFGEPTPHTPTG